MRNRLIIAVVTLLLVGVVYAQQPVNVVNTALHVILDSGVVTSITNTVTVSGTVTATGPLTDTQLRATPVPVSGTVTTGGLTDTQLRASAVPISISSGSIANTTFASTQGTSPWIVAGGGTAGTAASGVLTIQGIASMTKLLVTPDANSAVNAQPTPVTSGGTSSCVLQSTASTNSTNCKNAAGQIYNIETINTSSTIYYLRLYNSSSAPTCSSATGFVRTIPIPHATGAGAGISSNYSMGEAYGTGISFCFTGGGSSTDNTNAATGTYITILYK